MRNAGLKDVEIVRDSSYPQSLEDRFRLVISGGNPLAVQSLLGRQTGKERRIFEEMLIAETEKPTVGDALKKLEGLFSERLSHPRATHNRPAGWRTKVL